jgi:surface antigen
VYSIDKPIVSIAWRVPKKARTLTWTVRLRCASNTKKLKSTQPLKRTLAIQGTKRGIRRLFNPGSVRFTTGARGKTYSGLAEPTYPEGGKGGVDCSPGVLDGTTYCTGYCTWYAYQQRPAENLEGLGNAATWYDRARARGIPVGGNPQVGAIAWWAGTTSNPAGHVAYVTGVSGSNVTISEMNYVAWNRVSSRTLPRDGRLPGGYIYGGPVGDPGPGGSGAAPSPPPPDVGKPAVIQRSPDTMDVFYRDGAGNLINEYWNASTGWQRQAIASGVAGDPTAIARTSGNMDVFYRDSGSNLINAYWTPASGWVTQGLASGVGGDPTAIANSPSWMNVFYRSSGGGLTNAYWDSGTGWHTQPLP